MLWRIFHLDDNQFCVVACPIFTIFEQRFLFDNNIHIQYLIGSLANDICITFRIWYNEMWEYSGVDIS